MVIPRGLRLIRIGGDGLTRFGAVMLVALIALGVLGPLLAVAGDGTSMAGPRLAPPALEWPFGTDSLGRSLLPRVLEGIRTTFLLASAAVLVTAIIGTLLGSIAARFGGWLDEVIVRLADVLFSFPAILLAILVAAVLGPGGSGAVASVILVTLPLMTRVVRAAALSVVNRDFVIAARVGGASAGREIFIHVLPNVAGAAVVQATYAISLGMLVESAISFLGLGVQPPEASLGSLLREGSIYLTLAPWLVLGPGIVLAIAILAVNLVGDGVRDALDPRTRRGLA